MSNLVIVESPSKANTIKGYLGSNYKVIASVGHVRDLPKSSLGIDIENGFKPHYINIRGKGDIIKELKKEAKKANKIFLATDPDREGEAISWHIAEQLEIPADKACRVTFNEITKNAVKEAIKKPRQINEDLVNSQQARRILDRLVGFKLSEVLWKKVKSGLSGGRVQSVAARMITEREEEIRAFVPQEYWTVDLTLVNSTGETLNAKFFGDKNGKMRIATEIEANAVLEALSTGKYSITSVKKAERIKNPAPPFNTSTLLQEASKKLGFQAQKIMKIAQELYDGVNLGSEFGGFHGLITYMRTDSLRISQVAQESAMSYIKSHFGDDSVPEIPRSYKSDEDSQDAHEAIRPSDVRLTPKKIRKALSSDQYRLYKLIWERFIASQMQPAILDTISVEIENSGYIFKAGGYTIKSYGYMSLYESSESEEEEVNLSKLPIVKESEILEVESIIPERHFTEPPSRFTEASLIKYFKETGIGRPSTYSSIISIIVSRDYIKREGKSLAATELGEITTEFIKKNFPDIVDYEFTASMEEKLDSIENRENTIEGVLSEFYETFKKNLDEAEKADSVSSTLNSAVESEVLCEKCGAKMVFKNGRFGKFLACPKYPVCKNTKAIDENGNIIEPEAPKRELAGFECERCGGEMLIRKGKFGEFYACENYPKCSFTKQKVIDINVNCPSCGSKILGRHGKKNSIYYSCEQFPKCSFTTWDRPLSSGCPDCGSMLYYKASKKLIYCKSPVCDYSEERELKFEE